MSPQPARAYEPVIARLIRAAFRTAAKSPCPTPRCWRSIPALRCAAARQPGVPGGRRSSGMRSSSTGSSKPNSKRSVGRAGILISCWCASPRRTRGRRPLGNESSVRKFPTAPDSRPTDGASKRASTAKIVALRALATALVDRALRRSMLLRRQSRIIWHRPRSGRSTRQSLLFVSIPDRSCGSIPPLL